MDVDEVLTTTRAVRKRIDLERPVPLPVLAECIDIALQAPSGGNRQGWHFLVVTDAGRRRQLADLYREAWADYRGSQSWEFAPEDVRTQRRRAVFDSAQYLADHLHEVPVHVIPVIDGSVTGLPLNSVAAKFGSILPAAWSFMLAARARGLGSSFTTMHLRRAAEAARILDIPDDVTQCALLPVGYMVGGELHRARRLPVGDVTFLDAWGQTFPTA